MTSGASKKKTDEAAAAGAQHKLAAEMIKQAHEQGLALTGPDGLLGQLTKTERTEHLGYDKHDPAGRGSGNSRNGTRSKTMPTEIGPVEIEVPQDTDSSFEPQIVRKRQRWLAGV
uniref:transposase n=1 Tax=Amycolatopsis aidingensis TaxID=2842453 RepID=UPI001C0AA000